MNIQFQHARALTGGKAIVCLVNAYATEPVRIFSEYRPDEGAEWPCPYHEGTGIAALRPEREQALFVSALDVTVRIALPLCERRATEYYECMSDAALPSGCSALDLLNALIEASRPAPNDVWRAIIGTIKSEQHFAIQRENRAWQK
jgi:hypothetical protein